MDSVPSRAGLEAALIDAGAYALWFPPFTSLLG